MGSEAANPLSAFRVLLGAGLFAVLWIIFGAGAAHAADPETPTTGQGPGHVSSLTAPVTSLGTTAGQPVSPRPVSTSPQGQMPAKAAPLPQQPAFAKPSGGLITQVTPVLGAVSAPVSGFAESVTAPVAPIVNAVTAPVAPIVGAVTAPVTPIVNEVTAPVAPIVGAVTAPVTPIVNEVTAPVAPIVGAVTAPVAPIVNAIVTAPVAPIVGAVTGLVPGTAGDGPTGMDPASQAGLSTEPHEAVAGMLADTGPSAVSSAPPLSGRNPVSVSPASDFLRFMPAAMFPDGTAAMASMAGTRLPDQDPVRLPGQGGTAGVPGLSSAGPGTGGQGAGGGSAGAGQQQVADLAYRFILPVRRGGEGSLFSFALPGSPDQEPGYSPD